MRSDERSGAVFIALLFLWGTLVAEPLHIYTHYIRKIVDACAMFFGVEDTSTAGVSIVVCIVFVALGVILLQVSDTTFAPFLGTLLFLITAIGYVINSIIDHNMSMVTVIVFVISAVVLAFFHITRDDKSLVWAGDIFIGAHAVYILTNFMFVPISKLGKTIDKILYSTNYQDKDLTTGFDGFLRIPGVVWGSFLAIISILPLVYLALTRRKS